MRLLDSFHQQLKLPLTILRFSGSQIYITGSVTNIIVRWIYNINKNKFKIQELTYLRHPIFLRFP